jgi:transcriptional antiterminator RfaH
MSIHLDFWRETSWFVVQTKAHQEPLAAARVAKLALEVFLPQLREERSVGRGIRRVIKALFPGYFFTRFCPLESLDAVRYAPGVLRVVVSGRFPIPVDDEIVRDIQDRVEEDGLIRIHPESLEPGDRVFIQCGPFEGMMGRVERELTDQKRVAILLETLLQARVLIERRWLRAA